MNPIRLTVDLGSPVPAYEQVRRQVVDQVADGRLVAGDRLPPVRRLADELRLAAGTVARAYRELESAGIVVTASRAGTRVAPHARSETGADAAKQLSTAAQTFASAVQRTGASPGAAMAAVEAALRASNRSERAR